MSRETDGQRATPDSLDRWGAQAVAASRRLYRGLLIAYPVRFRREFGPEMEQVFHQATTAALRDRGAVALLDVWRATVIDLAATASVERVREGFSMPRMSRARLVRLGGLSLIVAAVAQVIVTLTQGVIELDFALSYANPTGHSIWESPWIGRGEAVASLGPLVAVLLLLGVIGIQALGSADLGAFGWVTSTLTSVGLALEAGAGLIVVALTASQVSVCVNPRDCNLYDPDHLLQTLYSVNMLAALLTTVGLILFGVALLRARPLGRGDALPLWIGVVSALAFIVPFAAFALVHGMDAAGSVKVQVVSDVFALVLAALIALLGRALLHVSVPDVGTQTTTSSLGQSESA